MEDEDLIRTEIKIAEEDNAFESGIMTYGKLSPFTCPECHGVMNELKDGATRGPVTAVTPATRSRPTVC